MPDGIVFRSLTGADAPAWWELRREALRNDPDAYGISLEEHEARPVADVARRFDDQPRDDFTLGAFAAGSLVGTLRFVRQPGTRERHKADIYSVYVTPSCRKRGVGRAIVQTAIDRAAADVTLEQIHIYVMTTQSAAKRLYESMGWVTYGTQPHSMWTGKRYLDEDEMVLFLRGPKG